MAEGLFRQLASRHLGCSEHELRERDIDVLSAGIAASENCPAAQEAIELLGDQGVDLTQHLSRQVTAEMVSESDVILAMTANHLSVLQNARPELAGRMRMLRPDGRDVSDPIGGGVEVYRDCSRELAESIESLVNELFEKDLD